MEEVYCDRCGKPMADGGSVGYYCTDLECNQAAIKQFAVDWENKKLERAAKALVLAEGFTSEDAVVYQGMKSVPVWTTRIERVKVVIKAYEHG